MMLCTEGVAVLSVDFKCYPMRKGDFLSVSSEMSFVPISISHSFKAHLVALPINVCEEAY